MWLNIWTFWYVWFFTTLLDWWVDCLTHTRFLLYVYSPHDTTYSMFHKTENVRRNNQTLLHQTHLHKQRQSAVKLNRACLDDDVNVSISIEFEIRSSRGWSKLICMLFILFLEQNEFVLWPFVELVHLTIKLVFEWITTFHRMV